MSANVFTDVDYYQLLDIPYDSTDTAIKKAYRLKALKCHPDKNPDNPKAADEFHELSKAYDVLSDEKAKLAYDSLLRARIDRKRKHAAMDADKKKMKDDLLEREDFFKKQKQTEEEAEVRLMSELDRLRADGERRRREREAELARGTEEAKRVAADEKMAARHDALEAALKVKWRRKKYNFSVEALEKLFGRFGKVDDVVSRKDGLAILSFTNVLSAMAAMDGAPGTSSFEPFEISWAVGQEPAAVKNIREKNNAPQLKADVPPISNNDSKNGTLDFASFASFPSSPATFAADYESKTLERLKRAAAERDRLAADIREREKAEEAATANGG